MNAAFAPEPSAAPFRSWRTAMAVTGAWMLLGMLFLLEERAAGAGPLTGAMVFRRMAGPLLGAALTPAGFWMARRFRIQAPRRMRNLAIHAAAAIALTLASFTLLYFVHRAAGTLAAQPLVAWLASTVHEGLLYCAVVLSVAHVLQRHPPAPAVAAPASAPAGEVDDGGDEVADVRRTPAAGHVPLKLRDRTILVAPAEIAWIEADGHHVRFHLAGGASHLVRDTLRRLESVLAPGTFVRVHRSALVNVAQVKELRPWFAGDSLIQLRNGMEVRMSRRYAGRLRALLGG